MTHRAEFTKESLSYIARQGSSEEAKAVSRQWFNHPDLRHYSYNFTYLGRPIIQYPQDIVATQELIYQIQPDLIIETGIAHGGSLIMSSACLELNALCGGPQNACVVGIDIDIRPHNRTHIEAHPMSKRIKMLEGSSITPEVIEAIYTIAKDFKNILVLLDSNHTHDHVLAELEAYAHLVTKESYCVVFDTVIEHMPQGAFPHRPWDKGNNPMTAVDAFLEKHPEFIIDEMMDAKLMISVAPRGYLKKVL